MMTQNMIEAWSDAAYSQCDIEQRRDQSSRRHFENLIKISFLNNRENKLRKAYRAPLDSSYVLRFSAFSFERTGKLENFLMRIPKQDADLDVCALIKSSGKFSRAKNYRTDSYCLAPRQ